MEAGVNPNTMQRALQELEREEMVFSQRTSGRFVTEDAARINAAKKSLAGEQIDAFLQAMSRLGYNGAEITALITESIKEENNGSDS